MRYILNYCIRIFFIAVLFTSCKKDGDPYTLQQGVYKTGTLSSTVSTLVLTSATQNDMVLRLTWPAADFGPMPVITYTLEIDVPADTVAGQDWRKAKSITVGNNMQEISFTGKNLNATLNAMALAPGTANTIVFRIRSDVNQYNGSASTIPPVYSNTWVMKITSYALNLYVPGDYQGWNPGAAPVISPVDGRPGLFEGYVNMPGAGQHYFKYTSEPDWNHINYGDGGNGTFSTDGAAAGLSVPDGGYYELTANMNNNTWTATKTTWSIIGDATPGGWNNDTQMTYDPVAQVWKVTANMIKNGSFKFRANNDWKIDFGIDNAGKLVYADNPFLGYTPNLNNLSVPADGNYTITLDLHVSGKYTYILQKN